MDISELKHLNSGECADIYEVNSNTVLKLGKQGWSKDMLYQEYLNAKSISNSKIPAPKIYDFVEIENRFGYTMEKLHDTTVLEMIVKRPYKIGFYAKQMAMIHHQIHTANAPKELPLMEDEFSKTISKKVSLTDDEKKLILKEISMLCDTEQCQICHGDFHPMNVLVDGTKYSVIDWVLATRGTPASDVAGAYLIAKYSPNLYDNLFMRLITGFGSSIYAKIYLNKYVSISGIKKEDILLWIPIRAALYMDFGLHERFNKKFYRIVKRHYQNQQI